MRLNGCLAESVKFWHSALRLWHGHVAGDGQLISSCSWPWLPQRLRKPQRLRNSGRCSRLGLTTAGPPLALGGGHLTDATHLDTLARKAGSNLLDQFPRAGFVKPPLAVASDPLSVNT